MHVAVIGNTPVNGGLAVAADLALAGHRIAFAAWPGEEHLLDSLRAQGGISVTGNVQVAISGRGGLAMPHFCGTLAEAVEEAELIVLDMPAPEFENRFDKLLPHLRFGQHVHVNMHGYWPGLRLAPRLREAGREDVTISEGAAPTHAADYRNGTLAMQWVRRNVPVAVFPGNRRDAAMRRLLTVFPTLVGARSVLETGFGGLNMMVHFPLVLLNIGWADRLEAAGEPVPLYQEGATRHVSVLVEALDAERRIVADAYGVSWRPLAAYLSDYYGGTGTSTEEAIGSAAYYRDLPPYPAPAWRRWLVSDVPCGHVPMTQFAALAGIAVPLHSAAVAIASALLGRDFAREGVTLARLGLERAGLEQVTAYVEHGSLA